MPETNSTTIPRCEQCNRSIFARPENFHEKKRNFRFCSKDCRRHFFLKYLGWRLRPKKSPYDYPAKHKINILICNNKYCRKEYPGRWWYGGNFCCYKCRIRFYAYTYDAKLLDN